MDFCRLCVIFLICEYQFLGRVCEIFVNLGPDAAAWAFFGARRDGDFAGPCRRFGARVYPYTSRRCGAVQRPYMGPTMDTKNAPLFSGAGIMFYLLRFAFW